MTTRELLVEAAAELFYEQGIHRTGIDAVVERSGFSKPTLYKYFRSKDELVTAVLELRARDRRARLETVAAEAGGEPLEALAAVIDFFAAWYRSEDFRGCALVNGAVELPTPSHPGRQVARAHKAWMTGFLERLAAEAALTAPRAFAEELVLLEEGATVMAYLGDPEGVGERLRAAASALLAAHQTGSVA